MSLFKKFRFFIIPFILCAIILAVVYFQGFYTTVVSFLVFTLLLFLVAVFVTIMLLPMEYGKTRWRRVALLAVAAVAGSGFWVITNTDKVKEWKTLYDKHFPWLIKYFSATELWIAVLLFLALILFVVLHFLIQDKSAMRTHQNSFDTLFPEKEFKGRVKSFCTFLENQLKQLDRDTNWSDAHFVPLDAEVEVLTDYKKKRRITDLLSAIKKDKRSKTFLVLGDPGAGKSVALRTLSKDLLKEVMYTYKIPVYINLKEWQVDQKWSEEHPPAYQALYDFVFSYLKSKDVFADEFLDKYFRRLFENGHIFFIFDSFDEIPAVLDENESSWLIDKLSEVFHNFLAGANDSRGILASRMFRRPGKNFQSRTTFEIRPFSELKIEKALEKYVSFDKTLIKRLFKDRPEFLPIASNPFSVGLIYNYTKDNNNELPNNQAELYSSYIDKRLTSCEERLQKKGLTKQAVLEHAVAIAYHMFDKRNLGLEANIDELERAFRDLPIRETIEILVYARLGRLGGGNENRFSFVHRRFNEYFVVKRLLEDPTLIDISSISLDSRYRDALVLYCEITSDEEAKRIADFCWSEIKEIEHVSLNDIQYLKGVNCLRFLREAYRARLECLAAFQDELAQLIWSQITKSRLTGNILFVKLAIESVGILKKEHMPEIILKAFQLNNSWINDTAVKSSRYLTDLDVRLKKKIIIYIDSFPILDFLKVRKELLFSFKLSHEFRKLRNYVFLKNIDNCLKIAGILPVFLFSAPVALMIVFFISLYDLLRWGNNSASLSSSYVVLKVLPSFYVVLSLLVLHKLVMVNNHMFNYIIICVLYVFVLIAYIPFYSILMLCKGFYKFNFKDKKKLKENIILILIGIALGAIMIKFSKTIYMKYVMYSLFVLIILASFCGFCFIFYEHVCDYLKLKALRKSELMDTRPFIAQNYSEFRTDAFRLRFAYLVMNNINSCSGSWPDDKLPYKDEKSGNVLARFEEKMLGLDR